MSGWPDRPASEPRVDEEAAGPSIRWFGVRSGFAALGFLPRRRYVDPIDTTQLW